jgi:hypothetical protein
MESKTAAKQFILSRYPEADFEDKSGVINGNFWKGIEGIAEEFSNQQNAGLVEENKKLYEALLALIDDINPHSFPVQTWRDTDFSNGRVGSKRVGLPDDIVINAVIILKEHGK